MRSFRLFTGAALAAATVPRLAHRGMFVDGVTYSSIARNLAEGRGTFWTPSYTATIHPQFYDHPPLGFWLQSLWFRVLGDHWFVERAYSLVAALIAAWLLATIWRTLSADADERHDEWLPVLLWIAVPVVSWAIVGNLLEVTVSVFTTAAVAAALNAEIAGGLLPSIGWAALSGASVVAAVLTKGPIGLFPLAAPILLMPALRALPSAGPRRPALTMATQWAIVAICGVVLMSVPVARSSLTQYVNQQVMAALSGTREVSASPWTALKELLQGILLPLSIAAGLVVAAAGRLGVPSRSEQAAAISCLLVGLAGTLPILASSKQAGHYLVPSVPFYSLAAASSIAATVKLALGRIAAKRLSWILCAVTAALLAGAIAASFSPALGRDRQRLADIDRVAALIPRGTTIGICPASNTEWGLHAWFERRFLVSLDARSEPAREWFLDVAGHSQPGCPPSHCVPASERGHELVLLKCSAVER